VVVVGTQGRLETSSRGLHVHDRAVDAAAAPTRLAINLAKGAVADVERGAVVTTDPAFGASRALDVELRLLRPLKSGAAFEAYVGTARSAAKVRVLRADDEERPRALARLALDHALPATGDDRVILRASTSRGPSGAVVAGGRVLDARPPPARRRAARTAALDAASAGDATGLARSLAEEAAPRPIVPSGLGARFPIEVAALERAAEKLVERGELVRVKPEGWVLRAAVSELAALARSLVAAHHEAHPIDRGMGLETLRQKLAQRAGLGVAAEAIRAASKKGVEDPLVVESDVARLVRFDPDAPSAAIGPLASARRALAAAGLKGLGAHALAEATGATARDLRAALTRLVKEGHAVTASEQWFDAAAVDGLRSQVAARLKADGVLTIAAFKELSGLGRKQAIPLLELFDREGTTKRSGDDRVPGPGRR
jgi:selenocysteine-specific elongation factor